MNTGPDNLLEAGTELGGFRIESFLGNGNMGIVYRAEQITLKRPVALKVLFDSVAQDEDFVRSFFREAQAAAAFTHQNIVQAYDVGKTEEGTYYFAMELIDDGDISDILKDQETISPKEALKMIVGVVDGLDYGQKLRTLTHGDIKPANILINSDGVSKLADLGLARMGGEIQGESDGIMLTPLYAAPEMIRGQWQVGDPRADMYSLGATLYHMISGAPPFQADNYELVMEMQVSDAHIPLSEKCGTPRDISSIVDKLLRKDPDDRYETWSDCKNAMEDAIAGKKKEKKKKVLHYNKTSSPTLTTSQNLTDSLDFDTKSSSKKLMIIMAICSLILLGVIAKIITGGNNTGTPENPGTEDKWGQFEATLKDLPIKKSISATEDFIKENPDIEAAKTRLEELKSSLKKGIANFNKTIGSITGTLRNKSSISNDEADNLMEQLDKAEAPIAPLNKTRRENKKKLLNLIGSKTNVVKNPISSTANIFLDKYYLSINKIKKHPRWVPHMVEFVKAVKSYPQELKNTKNKYTVSSSLSDKLPAILGIVKNPEIISKLKNKSIKIGHNSLDHRTIVGIENGLFKLEKNYDIGLIRQNIPLSSAAINSIIMPVSKLCVDAEIVSGEEKDTMIFLCLLIRPEEGKNLIDKTTNKDVKEALKELLKDTEKSDLETEQIYKINKVKWLLSEDTKTQAKEAMDILKDIKSSKSRYSKRYQGTIDGLMRTAKIKSRK